MVTALLAFHAQQRIYESGLDVSQPDVSEVRSRLLQGSQHVCRRVVAKFALDLQVYVSFYGVRIASYSWAGQVK